MSYAKPRDIAGLIRRQLEIPTIPAVAGKVLQELAKPDPYPERIATIIATDQGLTSRILRVANSAFYGLRREVKNLTQAVIVLGLETLRSLVLASSTRLIYKRFGPIEKTLWEHSMGAAIAAHLITTQKRMDGRDHAFVTGLMHDVGKVVMNNESPDKFRQVLDLIEQEQIASVDAENKIFSFSHTDVGALLIQNWKLSKELECAVFLHHDLDLAETVAAEHVTSIRVTHVADLVTHILGLGCVQGDERALREQALDVAVEFGFAEDELNLLIEQVFRTFQNEKSLFE